MHGRNCLAHNNALKSQGYLYDQMNIIILSGKHGQSRTLHLSSGWRLALLLVLVLTPVVGGFGGWLLGQKFAQPVLDEKTVAQWQASVEAQASELQALEETTRDRLRGLTVRMAEMQAQLVRIDALGERLVEVAGLPAEEFDFSVPPAVGGPDAAAAETFVSPEPPDLTHALQSMALTIERRSQQLDILETLMSDRRQSAQTRLAGRPVRSGWMSSRYGKRTDPFTGHTAWHRGVDFAARNGADVIATGAGVVTFAGRRWGYGNLIEISHGNGTTTRYGHVSELLAEPGDIVRAGELIARVGSTGRSTGPHVHYEVLQAGRQVDPMPFVSRTRQ